jgi:hypothetical protein
LGFIKAGDNHFNPLYLGGSNSQPIGFLTEAEHNDFHEYMDETGLGFTGRNGPRAREIWGQMGQVERIDHIVKAACRANLSESKMETLIERMPEIMEGENPGIKTARGNMGEGMWAKGVGEFGEGLSANGILGSSLNSLSIANMVTGAIAMNKEMKMSNYVMGTLIFQDVLGNHFYLQRQRTGIFRWDRFYRIYIDGTFAGQRDEVDRWFYDDCKEEYEKREGYINWLGDFVPGTERKELPKMDPRMWPGGQMPTLA